MGGGWGATVSSRMTTLNRFVKRHKWRSAIVRVPRFFVAGQGTTGARVSTFRSNGNNLDLAGSLYDVRPNKNRERRNNKETGGVLRYRK